ncbi:MAG: (2Fe-2S)-binding protein [Planctomycetota bacterium]|nr:MAG: (2Fe-2S)-binding protein [Planctomycetota bacterium]
MKRITGDAPSGRVASGFSRREFLRGSGAAAAATALVGAGEVAAGAQDADKGDGVARGKITVVLDVNGAKHEVQAEPRTTLLDALRNQLHLTGAKPVSTDPSSGAATVLVDGKPACAASMLVLQAAGKKIQTVESLGGTKLDPVPAAFVSADAEQCGFCTPGFVVAVRAFLNEHPKATDDEIRSGLNGNICRCGTYANIIRAIAIVRGG